jgi:hypothetical protein
MLLTRLTKIKKLENETVREFNANFEKLLQQIPKIHHPRGQLSALPLHQIFLGKFWILSQRQGSKDYPGSQRNGHKNLA